MGLMSSLYTGVSGLNVSQNALNTTAHNLANVNTKGYVRQQVVQSDNSYLKLGVSAVSTLQTGLGVNIETIRQVRNTFLDKSYRQELGRQGFYQSQYETVNEVESMFGELEGVAFQDSLSSLWTSLQELSKEPDAIEVRATLVENAKSFLERASTISKQLSSYQTNLNSQISDKVNTINDIATQIHKLNEQICRFESNGVENANDLRDQRNNLLDELGGLVNITYKENTDGVVTVTAEGYPLVSESQTFKMGTASVSDTSSLLKPIWIAYGNIDVFNMDKIPTTSGNTDVGSLKGLLYSRGGKEANYTDIPLRENYSSDTDYEAAVKDFNNEINTSVIMTVQAQFDQLIHGVVTAINDILSPNKKVTIDDGAGGTTDIYILDEENAPMGMDEPDYTVGEALFNRKSTQRYTEQSVTIVNDDGTTETKTVKVYNEEDKNNKYSLFTLGEIEVNPEITNNYSKLPLSANKSGEIDTAATNALLNLWEKSFASISPNSLSVSNFKDYYTNFIGDLATRGNELKTISDNQTTMVGNIDDQRQQTAGVSSDEELTNLIKFQHAYNASSRFINVIDEMLEHIITQL
jgi:flagellar hook-associated protein 1